MSYWTLLRLTMAARSMCCFIKEGPTFMQFWSEKPMEIGG